MSGEPGLGAPMTFLKLCSGASALYLDSMAMQASLPDVSQVSDESIRRRAREGQRVTPEVELDNNDGVRSDDDPE